MVLRVALKIPVRVMRNARFPKLDYFTSVHRHLDNNFILHRSIAVNYSYKTKYTEYLTIQYNTHATMKIYNGNLVALASVIHRTDRRCQKWTVIPVAIVAWMMMMSIRWPPFAMAQDNRESAIHNINDILNRLQQRPIHTNLKAVIESCSG